MIKTSAEFLAFLRRYPFSATCVVLSLVLAGVAWFLRQERVSLDEILRGRTQEGAEMLAMLAAGPTTRQELELARDAAKRIEDNLVVEANLAENLWYFYKLEEQSKARLLELRQNSADPGEANERYRLIPFTLRLSGTYEQVFTYLQQLETGPRLAIIKTFAFRRREVGSTALSLDLTVELLAKK